MNDVSLFRSLPRDCPISLPTKGICGAASPFDGARCYRMVGHSGACMSDDELTREQERIAARINANYSRWGRL